MPCHIPDETTSLVQDVLREDDNERSNKINTKGEGKRTLTKEELRQKLAMVESFIEEKEANSIKASITAPTNEELSLCLKRLSKQFPNHDLSFIVSRLHQFLTHHCSKEAASSAGVLKISSNSDQIVIDNCFTPAVLRSNDEKRIAISFLNYGYGLKILREVIKDESITPTKYNNIITTIMKNTFRTIESTVKQLNKPIVSVGPAEERILRAPLVNCHKWLPEDQLITFYNFVKGASGLDQVNISSEFTCKLYHSIVLQLHQREEKGRIAKAKEARRGNHVKNQNSHSLKYQSIHSLKYQRTSSLKYQNSISLRSQDNYAIHSSSDSK